MTESTKTYSMGEAIEFEVEEAEILWARSHGRKNMTVEEVRATQKQQTVVTLTSLPGGRLTMYVEVCGKTPATKRVFYNRYQRIPGEGYVRVFHNTM